MEERHRALLLANRLEITSDLRFRDIRRRLLDSGTLNGENLDLIENQQTREDQAKALLDILPTRGPTAFAVFREALKHRYPHLARILKDEGQQGPPEAPRVFIIHAGEDKESFVRPLVATLQQEGLAEKDVFFDDVSIKPGEVIRDRIISTLSSQSLELVVVVVSTAFLNKPYWPRLEFETCLKNNKRIFPIWVDANEDSFKAFSELVGKYSPTLKQMSARRVQRDDVTDELTNIAAEVVQRLSTLRCSTPPPAGL
ncbi:NAD(+) hydrolase PdTIR-like [Branchiostoma floridae]|uniref:NAD(+) hydrolase PdTIR-like n=1 Tax=Branchiostoma floridae TaxID=7739 RepID=A0A9J7MB44_BRAFL|nr:NAD(+) hydrolase PdTIR-like [Branchiostoma floridae]